MKLFGFLCNIFVVGMLTMEERKLVGNNVQSVFKRLHISSVVDNVKIRSENYNNNFIPYLTKNTILGNHYIKIN